MKKLINSIKENKFLSVVIGIIILTVVGQIFFDEPILNAFLGLFPSIVQEVFDALFGGACSALGVIILVKTGFAFDNMIRDARGLGPRKEEVYKMANKVTYALAIATGVVITVLMLI